MLRMKRLKDTTEVRVTFAMPETTGPVSVVGDFNGWDPYAHPMRRRSNGTRSVAVRLAPGSYAFRYLADEGRWLGEERADYAAPNSIVHV